MDAKRRLCEGVVLPTAIYGADTWDMKADGQRRWDVLGMKCLSNRCGGSLRRMLRNDEMRKIAGVQNELSSRAERVVRRVVERYENERYAHAVLD